MLNEYDGTYVHKISIVDATLITVLCTTTVIQSVGMTLTLLCIASIVFIFS